MLFHGNDLTRNNYKRVYNIMCIRILVGIQAHAHKHTHIQKHLHIRTRTRTHERTLIYIHTRAYAPTNSHTRKY